jgi:hypothetical protein
MGEQTTILALSLFPESCTLPTIAEIEIISIASIGASCGDNQNRMNSTPIICAQNSPQFTKLLGK